MPVVSTACMLLVSSAKVTSVTLLYLLVDRQAPEEKTGKASLLHFAVPVMHHYILSLVWYQYTYIGTQGEEYLSTSTSTGCATVIACTLLKAFIMQVQRCWVQCLQYPTLSMVYR